jgi:hypothetical protein
MCAMRPSPNGFWLPVCIAKVVGVLNHRVASLPRLAFEGLSRVMGNYHAQFLGGLGAAMPPGYPVLRIFDSLSNYQQFST